MAKKIYPASSAGLSVSWSSTTNGLGISLRGYNEKLPLLFDIVTKKLKSIADDVNEATFEVLRADIKKTLYNSLVKVKSLSGEYFSDSLRENHWSEYELFQDVDKVSLEEIQKFQQKFFRQLKIKMLVEGNMTKAQTEPVVAMLRENLNPEPIDYDYSLKNRGYRLPEDNSVLRMKSLLKGDENSFSRIFYQVGPKTIKQNSILGVLDSILYQKAFDSLRSKDQLGYSVGTSIANHNEIMGFSIYVESQENKNSHVVVQEKMEAFMTVEAKKLIEDLSDEEFEDYRQALVKALQADELDLSVEFSRHWKEIVAGDFMFDRKELTTKVAKELTKIEIQESFKQITQQNVRKLTIQVVGGTQNESSSDDLVVEFLSEKLSDTEKIVTNVERFHYAMSLYPVVKPQV